METPYPVKRILIVTDGGGWEFYVGGSINDPDGFDWEIKEIRVLE